MKIMKKRLTILFFAIAAAVCLGVGLSACGSESDDVVRDSSGKQVPVYQGMVISSADTATTLSSDVKVYAGAASEPGASAEATSPVTGDVNIEGVDIATQIEVEGEDTLIEDEIEATFGVTGTGKSIYYADSGEDIFVTVKLSNPDKFEIMSFVLNGEKYTSYMFESGSDLENLIVKLNVGTKAGFSEYTIDEIKYVDGTEIKDVLLDGDTTVKCGVRTDNLPYATVTNEAVTLDEISMDVKVTDLYNLISESDGYCMAVIFDGSDDTIYTEYLEVGTNSLTFSSLKANTVYQYAVFAVYDDLSGAGVTLSYLYKENFRTKNIVLFDNVEVTKTGVSFSYLWYEGYENATINKLSLESEGDSKFNLLEEGATEVTGLLSNHGYTLTASYTGLDGSVESIHMSFTTLAMETPEVTIDSLTSTKTDITYSVTVTDEDGVGAITSVTLYRNGETVSSSEALAGEFENLFSNNKYTLTVVYTYDLNDGYGDQTLEVSGTVSTMAKVSPVISFDSVTSTKTEISYTVSVTDEDGLGSLTSVTVYHGNEVLTSGTSLSGEFTNLLSNNKYTVVVEYTYDANDGRGDQTLVVSKDITTEAMATPAVSIDLTSTKTDISYALTVADEDGVGEITSVTVVGASGTSDTGTETSGTIENLLSDNAYTLTVVYTYNLNDGEGDKTLTATKSVSTLPMTTPVVSIESLTSTQTEINYSVAISDEDGVGSITSVFATIGDSTVYGTEYGVISGLLSDNTYTVTVEYTYDLNDGNGDNAIILSQSIKTLAKSVPVAEIVYIDNDANEGMTIGVIFTDEDNTGTITSIGLYSGSELIENIDGAYFGEITYVNLTPDVLYTVKVSYEYNLNDGNGTQHGGIELSVLNEIIFKLESVSVLNTSAVSEGETITLRASLYNPSNVTFTSAVINGVTYEVSALSTSTRLLIEIVYEDQFAGGDTVLTLTGLTCAINGASYFIDVEANNSDSVFINGMLTVDDFSIVRFDDYGREEEAVYAFKSEQLYYKITLGNATGYDVYSVTVSGTVYSEDRIYMSEDKQTVYVAMSDTSTGSWNSKNLTSVSYRNETIDKSKVTSISVSYLRLKSDNIVEISTYEDLLSMDGWEYYKLVNDIDLSGREWANMDNYMYGVFDGNGYTISNVTAVTTYENETLYLGLFCNMQGVVMNLDVCDVLYMVTLDDTTGKSYDVYVGGFAARAGDSTIINCNISSSFQITSNGNYRIYIGAVFGKGLSDAKLENVVCKMNAIVNYVSGYYDCLGYWGDGDLLEIIDCTCDYSLTANNVNNQYVIIDDGYKFSCVDGEYTLIGYMGNETNLVLPESVNGNAYSIGDYAFNSSSVRTSLKSVVIPCGVTSTGEWAFYNCSSLTSVTIGSGVIIGNYTFYGCGALTNATIAEGVTTIGVGAFEDCKSLVTVVIPDSVTSIGENAFKNCSSLAYVTIPDAVTEIGNETFRECTSLVSVTIGSSVTTIGREAFYECTSLISVTIGSGVLSIGDDAFNGCTYLTEIIFYAASMRDLSSDNIFSNAGRYGSGITVTIGAGVTRIPAYLFASRNSNIITVVFEDNAKCTSIGENAFSNCSSLTSVYINDITAWYNTYFENGSANPLCNGASLYLSEQLLTDLTIPDSMTSVGDYTFYGCTSLESIIFPNGMTSVGDYTFYGCTSLESIIFPDSMTSIGDYTFYGCTSLESIIFSDSMTAIGNYTFCRCTSLETIFIPASVTSIGSCAFKSCFKLVIVAEVASKPSGWSSNWNYSDCLVFWGTSEVPTESVTYTFVTNGGSTVDSVTAVWISSCLVTTRDGYAFGGWYTDPEFSSDSRVSFPYRNTCDVTLYARWYYLDGITQSEGLEIVDGVIVGIGACADSVLVICMPIAERAFNECKQITAVYLYDGCYFIGYQAFASCENLKTVYFYQEEAPVIESDIFANTWDPSDFRTYVIESLYFEYLSVSDVYWQSSLVDGCKLCLI